MMRFSTPVRWILYVVGGLAAGLLLILAVVSFFRISIDLSQYKGPVESAATMVLGRPVTIDEKIVITTSLRPIFTLAGLMIGNPEGFGAGNFLEMETARVEIRLLPLLFWKIHISEINVAGLSVNLVEDDKGAVNWLFREAAEVSPQELSKRNKMAEERKWELASDSVMLQTLILKDIAVTLQRPGLAEPTKFEIEECTGAMRVGKPLSLAVKGVLRKQPYEASVAVASLEEFLKESRTWLEIKAEIAETHFEFSGVVDLARVTRSLQLKTSVTGDRLDSLNGLLGMDLPPFKSYKAASELSLQKKKLDLTDFVVQLGESKLNGKMAIDGAGARPEASVEFTSPLIQLEDFDVGDWSPEKENSAGAGVPEDVKEKTSPVGAKAQTGFPDKGRSGGGDSHEKAKALFSPEVLGTCDVHVNVKAQKVASGDDDLGSGSLTVTLKDGRISMAPVELNIPGGSFSFSTSFKPDQVASEASVRCSMKNFDFGVIVRGQNPQADMGGIINLDVDLTSTASRFDELLANGNGHFDFSGQLENLKAGIVDLWAVNLIAAVVSKEDDSQINCVLGRWTMKDGLLEPEIFLIDTSKIRICGKGQVDFKRESITLGMAPTPKKPQFFSLATPIQIAGSFDNFGLGVQPGGLVGTVVTFVTSPVHVPVRRLAGKKIPSDGSDVCSLPIGSDGRATVPVMDCP